MNHWKQMWYWIEKKEPALIIWIIVSCLVTGITPVFGIIMPKIMLDELLGEKDERKLMGMVVVLALGTLVCALGKALCKKKTSNLMEQFKVQYGFIRERKIWITCIGRLERQYTENRWRNRNVY